MNLDSLPNLNEDSGKVPSIKKSIYDYIPSIQDINLGTTLKDIDHGTETIFRIKTLPNNQFHYQFLDGGDIGRGVIIGEFKSKEYIGSLKDGNSETVLGMIFPTMIESRSLILEKYIGTRSDEELKKAAELTFNDIINHPEIQEDAETFIKLNKGNPKTIEPDLSENIEISYGFNKHYYININDFEVSDVEIKESNNGVYDDKKVFIKAYPKECKILQSPKLDRQIKYEITWVSKTGRYPIPTEGNPKNIISQLDNSGLILDEYKAHNKLAFILNWMAERNLMIKDYGIKEPGFHWLNDKIIPVDYECEKLPDPEDLKKSLELLEDFGGYFKTSNYDIRDKVATIFKLTLLNPFDYVKKELDYDREIILSYGAPGTAKTSLIQLVRFVYNIPKDYFIESGGSANTPAQLSGLMIESTFPKMVDEAENIFRKPELVSLNKQSMNGLYSRKIRDKHQNEKIQPSYATLLYNSNEIPFKLSKDGSVRRYNIIHFDETQRPSEDEKEEFKDKWKASDKGHYQKDTPLNDLKYIGQFVAYQIVNNPSLLKEDSRSLTDKLVKNMYQYAELSGDSPGWLMQWCKLEDEKSFRASENEKIIYFIRKSIENAHKFRVQEVTDEGRPENTFEDDITHKPEFYYKRIFEVANNPALPWLSIKKIKNNSYYLISSGILEELSKEIGLNISLSELAARFESFENKSIYLGPGTFRMVRVPRKAFEKLLYPEL
jgi:hypothetical protein